MKHMDRLPAILGIATAVPDYKIPQNTYRDFVTRALDLKKSHAQFLKRICSRSAINSRYFVVDDPLKSREQWSFLSHDYPSTVPTMTERNNLYKQEAPKLAYKAARNALKNWGGNAHDITHVISVSCTGVVAPGIEFLLLDLLGLKRDIQRLGINLMGCFGAFRGLLTARAFALENPKHRILLVCTEICSIHFQANLSLNYFVSNVLFADGSAAVVVGAEPTGHERGLWNIINYKAFAYPHSQDVMTWEASDHGFLMYLSPKVPDIVFELAHDFSKELLGEYADFSECTWPVHPGGKEIIRVIEKACNLEPWQTESAWEVLAEYGNMSSATFLFVLENLSKKKTKASWAVGLGFGPGLSFEGILLKGF